MRCSPSAQNEQQTAGGVLCGGGILTALLNVPALILAAMALKADRSDARAVASRMAMVTLLLVPVGIFFAVFLVQLGSDVIAAHAR